VLAVKIWQNLQVFWCGSGWNTKSGGW